METLNATQMRDMMLQVADAVVEAKEYLCEADRNIGDGDHGIGMAGGFEGVKQELAGERVRRCLSCFIHGWSDNDSHYGWGFWNHFRPVVLRWK